MSTYGYVCLGPQHYRERFGLSFEDLHVGMRIRHRPGIDISQQDNREDALDLINNAQLHFDSHYAQHTEWRKPLGVSTLTVQRLLGMGSRSWYRRRRLLAIDSIAMTHPVFGGDTLYAESTVTALNDNQDADVAEVSLTMTGHNQHAELVSKIAYRIELYRRDRHPEDIPGNTLAQEARFCLYHQNADGVLTEQTGLFFEDMAVGETFAHWPGRSIGFDESRLHALRSLEINPRWHDAAYLSDYPSITPAIFEPLVIGLTTALSTRTLGRVVANLGWTDIALPRPVLPGETLYAESLIRDVKISHSRPNQGIVQVQTSARVASGELVCRFQRALLVYRRDAGPYLAADY